MNPNIDRIDDAVLALLLLGLHEEKPGLEVLRLERHEPASRKGSDF